MVLQDNTMPRWYVVHTYSGYENRVAANLEKIVENRNMGHLIQAIKVPLDENPAGEGEKDPVETKKDSKSHRSEEHKLFPSYVLVKMIMNDESWHVVRNTTGVSGFVGPGSQPIPLRDDEVERLGMESEAVRLEFTVGDTVQIIDGPLKGIIETGTVAEISEDRKKVKIIVSMGGRESAIELGTSQVAKY